ncbi:hypothetical protein AV530_018871 [Patagioenas fasciata monilis]|uniref:Uncharacterized protein n=1 Tax=Patagioenas fasciata monilis TaxID=372326 RepID=A0A1V4JJV3_PATFA|nr:hypothetical protein AV530_018871 [Patagioenas fasciata monilis]
MPRQETPTLFGTRRCCGCLPPASLGLSTGLGRDLSQEIWLAPGQCHEATNTFPSPPNSTSQLGVVFG